MTALASRFGRSNSIVPSLLVAVAYIVAAKFGFTFAFATKQVTAVWPPTGIAIAALVLAGNRVWPGIWLGAFIVNAFSSEPLWTAATIAVSNTLAPVFGNFLLQRFEFQRTLVRVRDVVLLTLLGSAVPMVVSATNGVVQLALAKIVPWPAFGSVWWLWWTGDALGVLLVAPVILTWMSGSRRDKPGDGRAIELTLLGLAVAAASWLSFVSSFPLRFSVYPLIVWCALRFRQRETSTAIALVAVVAIWATTHGLGPWASGSLDLRLIQLDSWMAILAFTGLVLGAVTAEKRGAREALDVLLARTQDSVKTLQTAFLPTDLPSRPGLRCDALYIAAEREALVGGDWYDAFELPDGRVIITVGDIAGHGLEGAVVAARLRRSIFAAAFDAIGPAMILSKVDRTLHPELDVMATAMVAIISRDLTTMSYASAGHPPPILAGPHTPAHFLECGGPPFGVGLPITPSTRTVALERGAVLLFYTDGLTEFGRDIDRAESAALQGVSLLVGNPHIEHPAALVQHSVMGSRRPEDDTVLVVAQLTT